MSALARLDQASCVLLTCFPPPWSVRFSQRYEGGNIACGELCSAGQVRPFCAQSAAGSFEFSQHVIRDIVQIAFGELPARHDRIEPLSVVIDSR